MEARYYRHLDNSNVKCLLCPHECVITPGNSGICRVRTNTNGILFTEMYGKISSLNFDPIEKKPLYHFHPGKEILSLGSLGCNFHCQCCQNYEISQKGTMAIGSTRNITSDEILRLCNSRLGNIGVAYTYNEPSIGCEFVFDTAVAVKMAGFKNVMVSNGYINQKPLEDLLHVIDAFNIDIKSFNNVTHKKFTGGKLESVLSAAKTIRKTGIHLEITHLVVPGINDSLVEFKEMLKWIRINLGKEVPLHLSRYFPRFKMSNAATSSTILYSMAEVAKEKLDYVYIGNINDTSSQNTYCAQCQNTAIKRYGYSISKVGLDSSGCCINCGYKIVQD